MRSSSSRPFQSAGRLGATVPARQREGCGRTVRQFASIARGLPDVLRRRVTHPGSLTGSAEWVRGASRAARGA